MQFNFIADQTILWYNSSIKREGAHNMRILYIDIDTLRPDHMGAYGYPRNTTPNMDAIALEGTRFNCMYTSDAPCLPSRAALISGMFGIHNGAVGHGGTAADRRLTGADRDFMDQIDLNNFNRIFRRAGIHTVSISTFPERHSSYWFSAGFHETYNQGGCGGESAETLTPIALDWLERRGKEDNWYLHFHLWDPHTPYRAPKEFGNPFENDPVPTFITEKILEGHQHIASPHGAREIGMYTDIENPAFPRHPGSVRDMAGVRRFIDGYDCGIKWADEACGMLFKKLKDLGIYDDTAVIITSDHGENMGELGLYAEHATADEPTCHIPMIIKWPGIEGGKTDNGLHYQLDLAPTLSDLLNVSKSENWDGESFAGSITQGGDTGRDSLVLSQMAHVCQRSARFDDWLYIRTVHDGFHLFDQEMLFNIKDDPHELNDVKDLHPDVCAKGARIILNWHENQMLKSASPVDPMWTVMHEGGPYHAKGWKDAYVKRLYETGREEAAKKLEEKDYHTK